MTNAIEIQGLKKHYKGFDLGLDLTLPSGCILGLIGENGAGKTTVIKCILGMTRPDGGSIRVLGQPQDKDFPQVREDIGVVLDATAFPESFSPRQIGQVMAGIYKNWDAAAFAAHLRHLNVPEKKPFKELSRGNRMKVSISVALSHHPKLLILDEPTSGLDPVVRDEVVNMLLDFTREEDHSILISSHIVSDLEKLCDYIVFLKQGTLMLCEEKDRLLEEYCLVQCSAQELGRVDPEAIMGKRETAYGVSALVLRAAVPAGYVTAPVSIEELFVLMASSEQRR